MRFAKWVFLVSAVYGLIALLPQYFVKPPTERPEFFYGFVGVFLLTSRDVTRFRPKRT